MMAGNVGVHRLVVREPGADGVGQRHVARPIGVQQARHAQVRVGTERQRVQEVVVDAPVDHVDAAQARRGPHVHDVVVDEQVAAFDERHAHLARQEGVLEVGGVRHPRRQHDDRGLGPARRRQRAQRRQQRAAVVRDGADVVAVEQARERPRSSPRGSPACTTRRSARAGCLRGRRSGRPPCGSGRCPRPRRRCRGGRARPAFPAGSACSSGPAPAERHLPRGSGPRGRRP